VGSALFISLLRSLIPDRVRIPIFIIVVATFVTTADYLLAAFVPDVHAVLGIFVPLIVVNCIVFGRVEAFSYRNPVPQAVADALGSGIGFTLAITLLGGIRELLGAGTLFGRPVLVGAIEPMLVMKLPTGAFVTLGLLIAAMNVYDSRRKRPSAAAECASCAKCGVGA
jgi:electron transport complex protein RnfE